MNLPDPASSLHVSRRTHKKRLRSPAGASKRAAAVQAAYAALLGVLPSQAADLKAERDASLEVIKAEESLVDDDDVMKASINWGNTVAAHALALRSGDALANTSWPDNLAIGKCTARFDPAPGSPRRRGSGPSPPAKMAGVCLAGV